MKIELRFFATFRDAVGEKTIHRTYRDGTTVREVLTDLEAEYEGLSENLLDERGEVRPNLSVLRNGRDVVHDAGSGTRLEEGDTLSVFPPVAGGDR